MAMREVYVDDLSGKEGDDIKPRKFSLGNRRYVIDLSDENFAQMKDDFEKYFKAGRADTAATSNASTPKRSTPSYDRAELLEWAHKNGVKVPERGRVSNKVIEQFKAATAKSSKSEAKSDSKGDSKK